MNQNAITAVQNIASPSRANRAVPTKSHTRPRLDLSEGSANTRSTIATSHGVRSATSTAGTKASMRRGKSRARAGEISPMYLSLEQRDRRRGRTEGRGRRPGPMSRPVPAGLTWSGRRDSNPRPPPWQGRPSHLAPTHPSCPIRSRRSELLSDVLLQPLVQP